MDPLGFLLDLIKAHDEIERVRAEAQERILRKYGAELGLDVPECCGGVTTPQPPAAAAPLTRGAEGTGGTENAEGKVDSAAGAAEG